MHCNLKEKKNKQDGKQIWKEGTWPKEVKTSNNRGFLHPNFRRSMNRSSFPNFRFRPIRGSFKTLIFYNQIQNLNKFAKKRYEILGNHFGDFSFLAAFFSAWSLKKFGQVCPEAVKW